MRPPEHRYQAFGLRIHSTLELPELTPAPADDAPPDIEVRLGEVGEPPGDGGGVRWETRPGRVLMSYEDACRLDVREGREIVVEVLGEPAATHGYVVGPALAMALGQRGDHVLHASAVAVDGRAVAFAGLAGEGKSTIAAALHARGHRYVADDVVPVRVADGRAVVLPGFPQQKLWPAAAAAVGLAADELPRVYGKIEKRARRLPDDFDTSPLPLAGVFVLEEGDDVSIEPLAGSAAAMELVRHSYDIVATRRFAAPANLDAAARLAGAVPVARLRRPWRLDALDETVDAVLTAGWGAEVAS